MIADTNICKVHHNISNITINLSIQFRIYLKKQIALCIINRALHNSKSQHCISFHQRASEREVKKQSERENAPAFRATSRCGCRSGGESGNRLHAFTATSNTRSSGACVS